jgi:hypothetical protein
VSHCTFFFFFLLFSQDVVQFKGLAATLLAATARDPLFVPQILGHVGLASVLDWSTHFAALGLYTLLYATLGHTVLAATDPAPADPAAAERSAGAGGNVCYNVPVARWAAALPAEHKYVWRRRAEAWKFGAGLDYEL